jgi:hypothetical protein
MTRLLWSIDLAGSVILMAVAAAQEDPMICFVGWIFALTSLRMLYTLRNEEIV